MPIEDIRASLKKGLAGKFDVDPVIDDYLDKESKQMAINLKDRKEITEEQLQEAAKQDAAETFGQLMERKREAMKEAYEKYDINDHDFLWFYEKGDSICPRLANTLGRYRKFLDSTLDEPYFAELKGKSAKKRLEWLVGQNRSVLIKDSDWETVFQNLSESPDTFARYYSIMRVKSDVLGTSDILRALMMNDDLYAYSKELADSVSESEDEE